MHKIHILFGLAVVLLTQPVFADDMSADSKPCATIANACLQAGYVRGTQDKKFWLDCMKPMIMGKTVTGVTVDPATVKACRVDKIEKLKKELMEFQNLKD